MADSSYSVKYQGIAGRKGRWTPKMIGVSSKGVPSNLTGTPKTYTQLLAFTGITILVKSSLSGASQEVFRHFRELPMVLGEERISPKAKFGGSFRSEHSVGRIKSISLNNMSDEYDFTL